jgi:hypothetical protein
MCGNHHHESRLVLGQLRGKRKRRKFASANGDARNRGAGRLRMKKIF